MEGYYIFVRPDGQEFRVEVPRFHLNGPLVLPGVGREPMEEARDPRTLH
jgi:hypothetical protein